MARPTLANLDRVITLRRATTATDAFNAPIETWADLAITRGSKMDVSDGERIRAMEVAAQISTRFQIRLSADWADLNPRDRLICDGREYDIVGVKELQRGRGLEISANARADQAVIS